MNGRDREIFLRQRLGCQRPGIPFMRRADGAGVAAHAALPEDEHENYDQ